MEEKRRTRIENGKVLLCFLIPALFCAWFRTAENYDEYWNLTFAKNVADGLLPYRDFNMLQTPLSCFLSGGILALFGKELIVLRLLGGCSVHRDHVGFVSDRPYPADSSGSLNGASLPFFGISFLECLLGVQLSSPVFSNYDSLAGSGSGYGSGQV